MEDTSLQGYFFPFVELQGSDPPNTIHLNKLLTLLALPVELKNES